MIKQSKNYYAFISYKREDEKWAKWLQRKLEYYKLPTSLKKLNSSLPDKLRPIFKDTTDLSGGVLEREIKEALSLSKYLIVICSPRAAQSPWVCKEVQEFIDLGREEFIIPFIIEGEPHSKDVSKECLPQGLRKLSGNRELLGISVNEMGRRAAVIKVIARMLGLKFDELWRRYERSRRVKTILWILVFVLSFFLGAGIYLFVKDLERSVEYERKEKISQKLYSEYLNCVKLLDEQKFIEAFNKSKEILNNEQLVDDVLFSKFEYILRMSYSSLQSDTLKISNRFVADFPAMDWGDMPVRFSENGDSIYVGCSGFSILDAETGANLSQKDFWPSDFRVYNDKIYCFDDFSCAVYDKETLELLHEFDIFESSGDYKSYLNSSVDGNRFCTLDEDRLCNIYDSNSGNLVNSFQVNGKASLNYNGKILAYADKQKLRLFNVDSGESIDQYNSLYASDLQFDQSGNWLLLNLEKYDIINVLNLETEQSYHLDIANLEEKWYNSFNFSGHIYANKYFISDDNRFLAIGGEIYDMADNSLYKRLESSEKAVGLKIFPDARRVIQVNWDKEIIVYTRNGKPMFDAVNVDFEKLMQDDQTKDKYDINVSYNGDITVKSKQSGHLMGEIKGINGDIYHLSISPDEKYLLVSSLAIPTSLYDVVTGELVQSFPFQTGDGDLGFGVIGKDGKLYFKGISTTYKYDLLPIGELCIIDIVR